MARRTIATMVALALGLALVAEPARSQLPPDPRPQPPKISACTQLTATGGVKIDLVATATGPWGVQLTWQGYPGDYTVKSTQGTAFSATQRLSPTRLKPARRGETPPPPQLEKGSATHSGAQPDFLYDYEITATLADGRAACGSASARTPPAPVLVPILPGPLTLPLCKAGAAVACSPTTAGACGQKTCAADGNSFGACTQVSCGFCAHGATLPCDYQGKAGTSHCAQGVRTCNAFGSAYGACADPEFQCGNWSSIDMKECASTGIGKYAGVLAGIPSGDDRQAYVLNHKATVFGKQVTARAFSTDLWGNAWGSFAIENKSCFVYNLTYLITCTSPLSGSVIYSNPATGKTFREGASIPCLSNCFGSNERKVYSSEPNWGSEPFPLSGGGGGPPRCETVVHKEFQW